MIQVNFVQHWNVGQILRIFYAKPNRQKCFSPSRNAMICAA